jgi:ATP-binding cassette subfamily B protein RaxB
MTGLVFPELRWPGERRLPMIETAEAAECGLACLAMIARYHGHDVDLTGLRQRFSISLMGTTLKSLMSMADQLGFSTRPLKLDMDALGKLALPAVLHWDLNHFVVLSKVTAKNVRIHDPAHGVRTLSLVEVSQRFTGVALELAPSADFAPVSLRAPLKVSQLWSSITGLSGVVAQIFLLSAALQVLAFAAPFQLQLAVDDVIANSDRSLLTVITLGFGALVVLQTAVGYLRDRVVLVASNLLGYQVVGNLVHHLLRLETAYFEKRNLGDILSRVRSSDPIRDAIAQGIISAIIDGTIALLAAVVLFFYSGLLAVIVLTSVALYFGVMLLAYPAMRDRTREQIMASAAEQTNIMESLRAVTTIKVLGREAEREAVWRNRYAEVINTQLATGSITISTTAAQNLIVGVQAVLVIYFAARMIMNAEGFSVGMLVAFFSFRQTFSDRMTSLIAQAFRFRLLGVHLSRMSDIVHARADTAQAGGFGISVQGGLRLERVCFRYGTHDRRILENVDLKIRPGEFVAIVGPSGGGKTTLMKLLLGLYPPDSGEIYLDDLPATNSVWQAWRLHVGLVAQDDRLLSGSIADNIAFFDPQLDMQRVFKAARAARIHDDVLRMPMQYLSLIGDMGSTLSGGQKQRVLLARALYREPKVLILDEGTANLDPDTEDSIADLICTLPITRIVVAHRPALVARAQRVLRMQDGRLHEIAPHALQSAPAG